MLLTKEADYSVRIMRALSDGEKRTVKTICDMENIPNKYAYKILKKLEVAGLVQSRQGPHGGYLLSADLSTVTLYDVVAAADEHIVILPCLRSDSQCALNTQQNPCTVHHELTRIQGSLVAELQRKNMKEVLCS
jgi:Rrf2 family protein